ncbi:MAG: type II toxin-antitoxin system VapC family toxin [bacterium]
MYCLDSNIIIFALKSESNSKLLEKIISKIGQNLAGTTSINVLELLYYSHKNNATKSLEKRTEILKILNIYDFDFKAAQIASKLKSDLEQKSLQIDNFDLIIASICLTNNLILVTNNTKHFQNIPNLKLEDWTL